MSLADALEAAATALPRDEDVIRPANGDPLRVLAACSPEAAGRVLAWLLCERADDAEELVEEWLREPKGREALLALREEDLAKPGRKALRRIRHRLRSSGVAVAEAPPAPGVASLPPVEPELSGAYLSALDPAGARIAYFVEPHPSGGARVFEVVLDDARGIVGFRILQAGRGNARRFLKDLATQERGGSTALAEDSVRAAIAHALAAQPKDRPPPRGFLEHRTRLAGAPPGSALPGELAERALASSVGPDDLAAAVKLVEEGRVGPWPPARERLVPLLERVRSDLASPLVVSGATQRDRLEGRLAEALGEIFDAAGAAVAAHRLRESAFSFWRAGDEAAARACLAAARAFAERAPGENPVARALLERPLRPALEALAREAEAARPGR